MKEPDRRGRLLMPVWMTGSELLDALPWLPSLLGTTAEHILLSSD